MLAFRQIIDDPTDVVSVPPELRHRPTEVIFIALEEGAVKATDRSLADLAGCQEGADLVQAPQGDYEQEIVLAKAGKPYTRLMAIASDIPLRRPGRLNGKVGESFFDPLPKEELDAWEGL